MASKRKINYQFRLFLPIVGMLWLIIIVFAVVQHKREQDYKTEALRSRIEIINKRVLALTDNGQDINPFLDFINDFFQASTLDEVSVALYDTTTGELVKAIGFDAPPPEKIEIRRGTLRGEQINKRMADDPLDPDMAFYYKEDESSDGRYIAQTIMPFNESVIREIKGTWWWAFIIIAGLGMTITTYLATHHLTRNVKLLRDFASKAASDRDFTFVDTFPNNELGDISRQIVHIYNTRKAAEVSRELEHRVALKATEERSTLKRQLTNNISHELKTPVGIIRGYVETMVENPEMEDDLRIHFLDKTHAQVERLCTLLEDLSIMTRLEEASTKIPLEEIDFNGFLARMQREIEESGIAGDMKFKIDIPDNCRIRGNNSLLTGVFMNLAKNAINYSRGTEMGVKLLAKNTRFYTFIFYDNGCGVDEEHIPHLFERFYRIDKGRSRKVGGTGLGLPIVRSSVNTMGGSVTVRNRREGGLEFVITLNIWHPRKSEQQAQSEQPE